MISPVCGFVKTIQLERKYHMKISEQFILLASAANKHKYHSKLTTVAAIIYDLILEGWIDFNEKNQLVANHQGESELTKFEKNIYEQTKKYSPIKMCLLISKIYVNFDARNIYKDVTAYFKLESISFEERTHSVIEELRAEVLEEGKMSEDSAILLLLMKQSKCMSYYFSKHEINAVSARIKHLKKSNEFRFYSVLKKTIILLDLLTWS